MARVRGGLWKNIVATHVYGANTGVGKTVFSTLLGAHFAKRPGNWGVRYIKPVSTGPADEADDSYVHRYSGQPVSTLFKFDLAVSPHVAARGATHLPDDEELNHVLYNHLEGEAQRLFHGANEKLIAIVETAGGVLSPAPSGTPQADVFRPLRLPAVLVGDHRLGGISSTISAAESLKVRGYDIMAVITFDDRSKYENASYLAEYFHERGISAFTVPWIPSLEGIKLGSPEEQDLMSRYYDVMSAKSTISDVAEHMIDQHTKRLADLESMSARTCEAIWHPFTQHGHVTHADQILTFDSAYGDYFQVKSHKSTGVSRKDEYNYSMLNPAYDGSASWWTQGLGHGNPKLALEAAYAAGRYGHVMFAGATHEPAITLAETMLQRLGNPRLKKIFYTDNGSTATEVGIKMGIRAACKHYGWNGSKVPVGVIGLRGSYHGDTIGAMDASEPCVFNEKVDWYRGRGYWFDYPTFSMKDGKWIVETPLTITQKLRAPQYFEQQDDIFNLEDRMDSYEARQYEKYIKQILNRLIQKGKLFGALILEPVILGAGGMKFVDPLFQRILVDVVRRTNFSGDQSRAAPSMLHGNNSDTHAWTGLPVIFDEVFTGLYRLGRFSSASFLGVYPDISAHAKLLTGGLLPLSITTASQSIFDAFLGSSKADALLHGHSYTAHAVGCHVANTSLTTMQSLDTSGQWQSYKQGWSNRGPESEVSQSVDATENNMQDHSFWSMWSKEFVTAVSKHKSVKSVNALGSVLAVSLVDQAGAGYQSDVAALLRDALGNEQPGEVRIHARILGNVIYLMASMTADPKHLKEVEAAFMARLIKSYN